MELLAPAGNMNQAIQSIKSGCDAIYGGLSNWNARISAENFSLDEYRRLLEICHQHGVKFYMTLNTLLRDEELESVANLLSRDDFLFPDALIVADIGLIKMLSVSFPQIDVHVSTQFGAYNIDDIAFLQSFHVKRVILARELTLSEISAIRSKTKMELEVFAYGSQCICFSGQCLWGGLTQKCSGNRGRCSAPCRDFYSHEKLMGQFLYPQDIDASQIVGNLHAAGINSIKIEGRLRDVEQTSDAVRKFRTAIDMLPQSACKFSHSYQGYLSNRTPVENMFHILHPRVETHPLSAPKYGEHDFLLQYQDDGTPTVRKGNQLADIPECYYIKTIFSKRVASLENAASVSLAFEGDVLVQLKFADNEGTPFAFHLDSRNVSVSRFTLIDLASIIRMKLHSEICELSSNISEFSSIRVNESSLMSVLDEINSLCKERKTTGTKLHKRTIPSYGDFMQISKADDLYKLKKAGFHRYIFDITSCNEFRKVLSILNDEDDCIIFKLPILDFSSRLSEILPLLRGKSVMVSRMSQLSFKEQYGFAEVFADYTLNIWNSYSLSILKEFGVTMFTAHPELSLDVSKSLSKKNAFPFSAILAGRIPLGYTRACFGETKLCDRNCGASAFCLDNVTKGYRVKISCDNDFGYRTITLSDTITIGENISGIQGRYSLSYLKQEEIDCILKGNKQKDDGAICIYGRNVE